MKIRCVNDNDFDKVIEFLHGKNVGFDVETTSKDFNVAKLAVMQVHIDDVSYLFPIRVLDAKLSDENIEKLRQTYTSWGVTGHNLMYDLSIIYREWGVFPARVNDDSMILALMKQAKIVALKELVKVHFPDEVKRVANFDDIARFNEADELVYSFKDRNQLIYMGLDPYYTLIVAEKLKKNLPEEPYRVELDLLFPLVKSSVEGLQFNRGSFNTAMAELEKQRDELQTKVDLQVGHPIKVNSSAQVRKVLFEEKQLPIPPVKTDKGEISTSEESLKFLAGNQLVDDILALKHLISVCSSTSKLPTYLDDADRIHPQYEPIGFDGTARIYTKPSLNQAPKEARACIEPSPGKRFLYADWKSAEMYIAAYLAKQENLLEVYSSGGDIHSWLASKVLGKENPSKADREVSKTCEFAFIYGSEGAAVSRALQVGEDTGKALVQQYLGYLSEIKTLRDSVQADADVTGRTSTILGRPRVLSLYGDPASVAKARRQAFNTKIQGSCADLQKMAIRKLYDMNNPRFNFKFTVFDSFLIEIDDDVTDEEIREVLDKMSDFSDRFPGLKLRYSYAVANDWRSAQDLA